MSLPAVLPERVVVRSTAPRARLLVAARWPVGGIRVHLQVNAPYLTEAGFACTFVGPAGEALDALHTGLGHLPGAEFVGVESTSGGCRLWPTLRRHVRSGRFALVHAHGMTAACHATAAVLGQGVPLLVTLHEPLRANQFVGLRGRVKRWLLGRLLRRSAGLVTVSEDARANLLESLPGLAFASDQLTVLSNGIDAARYDAAEFDPPGDLRRRLGLGADVAVIGFLGRFMPEKGFPVLLEALGRLSTRSGTPAWHLAAFGSSDYRREYQRRVAANGLSERVTLCDFVPDVRPLMPQLDLVVVPSLWEASSLVSMEAMAAGVPVLGSDCPGLREVLRDTPSRSVPVGDADALTAGLAEALRDPWTQTARAFAAAARARFDNARSARGLVDLIAQLARVREPFRREPAAEAGGSPQARGETGGRSREDSIASKASGKRQGILGRIANPSYSLPCSSPTKGVAMIWLLGFYMWMFIHRPFEYYPQLGAMQVERITMIFMIVAWLIWPYKVWTLNRLHVAHTILAAVILVSWVNSAYMDDNSYVIEAYFKVVVFYVLFVTTVRDEKDLRALVMAYLIAFGLYTSHSMLEYFNGRYTYRMGIRRMMGVDVTYGDPNQFAASIIYTLPMTLVIWWTNPPRWQKIVLTAYTGLVCSCVLLTGSRSGFVGLVACGFLVTMHSKHRKTMLAVGALLAVVGVALMAESLQNRLLTLIDPSYGPKNAQASASGRMHGFLFGIMAWQQSPLLGHGPNTFGEVTKRHGGAHNLYGQMLSEVGTLGTLAFLGLVVSVGLNEWESWRAHRGRPRGVSWWTCRAVSLNMLLLLLLGWSGHSFFRYYWVWYAAFQAAAIHCLRTRAPFLKQAAARLPYLAAPRRPVRGPTGGPGTRGLPRRGRIERPAPGGPLAS